MTLGAITEAPALASRSGESATRRDTGSREGQEPTLHTHTQSKTRQQERREQEQQKLAKQKRGEKPQ